MKLNLMLKTHYFPNTQQGGPTLIGVFALSQRHTLFPLIGVMYALHMLHNQLLKYHEAEDWLWIHYGCVCNTQECMDHECHTNHRL
jgi:hypothetical protein